MRSQIVLRKRSMPLQSQRIVTKEENSTSSIKSTPSTPSRKARCAEMAGGTAAECAAVCCCCPCGLLSLIVFAVVRLPAGLCRKAVQKQRRKKKKKKKTMMLCSLQQPKGYEDAERRMDEMERSEISPAISPGRWPDKSPSTVVSEMEKEMWTKLYGTGFWRNPSEKESVNGENGQILG